MTWHTGRLVGFDLETTGPEPETARIVTAAIASCGGGEQTDTATWLADPGVPIPQEATDVHGITTEHAAAHGRPAAEVVEEVRTLLVSEALGRPLVIFNARYDLTVLDRECRRYELEPLDGIPFRVVDPLVIDKWLDPYRKTKVDGSRKLGGMCALYGITLGDDAHDAAADALAACRLAWFLGDRGSHVLRASSRQRGKQQALREWESVRADLDRLHAWQVVQALRERDRFAEYQRRIGEHEVADRVEAERGWPLLELPAVTT